MKKERYTAGQAAQIVHATIAGVQHVQGDPAPVTTWAGETGTVRGYSVRTVEKARALVEAGLSDEEAARKIHDDWVASRVADGWVWGAEKDWERKTHPCLVPWDDSRLPEEQKDKDRVILAVVRIFR